MVIGLFTSVYFNNIGNGFIDLGAEAAIKKAMPEGAEFVKVSQCANFAASMGKSFLIKEVPAVNWAWTHIMQKFAGKFQDKSYKAIDTLDVFSVANLIHLDYLIIPGCVLTVPFFTIYGKLLENKTAEGCKLIFLGASGNFYNDYEVKIVTEYLRKIKPYAIMTRDSVAYKLYGHLANKAYNGIDNVFFVNLLEIPRLKTNQDPYVVVNLEEPKHNAIKNDLVKKLKQENINIIYSNHKPFPYSKVSKLAKEDNMMISDYPMDYLVLYKNAETVYSDRVHACIPTLSFGNQAILFSDSPRKALFENVGINNVGEPMKVSKLSELQNSQIDYLKLVLEK